MPPLLASSGVACVVLLACAAAATVDAAGSACGGEGDPASDWLVTPCGTPSTLTVSDGGATFTLSNGIVQRVLRVDPSSHTMFTSNLTALAEGGVETIQGAPVAEAALEVNGVPLLVGGPARAPTHPVGATRMAYAGYRAWPQGRTLAGNFTFTPGVRHSRADRSWPPQGQHVEFDHVVDCAVVEARQWGRRDTHGGASARAGTSTGGVINVTVAYELYDSTAAFGRRVHLTHNCSGTPLYVFNMTLWLSNMARDRFIATASDPNIGEGTLTSVDAPTPTGRIHSLQYTPITASHAFDAHVPSYGPGLSNFGAGDTFVSFFMSETVVGLPFPNATEYPRGFASRYSKTVSRTWRALSPQIEQYPVQAQLICTGGTEVGPSGAPVDGAAGYWCYDGAGQSALLESVTQGADVGVEAFNVAQNMNATWRSMVGNEFESAANMTWFKQVTDHAKSLGVESGAYQLLRNARSATARNQCAPSNAPLLANAGYDQMDLLPPVGTGRTCANFDRTTCKGGPGCCSLCAGTAFYDAMEASMLAFWDATGMTVVDQDGAEIGTPCANVSHLHHAGLNDSVWVNYQRVRGTYKAYMERGGMIVGMPGNFLEGGQAKLPGGYDEMTFSLPRWTWIHRLRERIIADPQERDLTTPNAMRYFPFPMVPYHQAEAGPDGKWLDVAGYETTATLEPLDKHTAELEWALATAFGTGVMAPMRGYRFYADAASKAVMVKWISWFKRYRPVLITDFTTLQCGTTCWGTASAAPEERCNVTTWDAIVHFAPAAEFPSVSTRAIAVVWNPLGSAVVGAQLRLPLYYAGLSTLNGTRHVSASIRQEESTPTVVPLEPSDDSVTVTFGVKALSVTWFVVEDAAGQ